MAAYSNERVAVIAVSVLYRMLTLISRDKDITTTHIASILNISRKNIAKHIRRLQEEGVIRRVGPDFGGHREIVKK
ncbi:MAG: winged helix-turn-helix transcriptional regulator [Bacteroides sp.]|nr:winged helix-turn-helix transcriptional regulator [Bacteroides sp.]